MQPDPDPATRHNLVRALLDWYAAMGVDVIVGETPVSRFEEGLPASSAEPARRTLVNSPPAPPATASSREPVLVNEETSRAARRAAASCSTLAELREALAAFEGCNLRLTARNLVFADGNPKSRLMLIGEAPGREEDIQGLPFVGRSGQLLDRMLAAIGLSRESVYIANIVPWRPPGNRTPTPQETAACRPFIERQIELAQPQLLVCLGNAATRELLGTNEGILRVRGQWRRFPCGSRLIAAMATLHPAYLLRTPSHKKLAWRDFLALRAALDGLTQD
jgi:DNA polymerase